MLSFGIGFAVAPLVWLSSREDVMGAWQIIGWLRVVAWAVVVVVVALNLVLVATWLVP